MSSVIENKSSERLEQQTNRAGEVSAEKYEVGFEASFNGSQPSAMLCPNCSSRLEGRKCKLFCLRPGCGYQVTCAEW